MIHKSFSRTFLLGAVILGALSACTQTSQIAAPVAATPETATGPSLDVYVIDFGGDIGLVPLSLGNPEDLRRQYNAAERMRGHAAYSASRAFHGPYPCPCCLSGRGAPAHIHPPSTVD